MYNINKIIMYLLNINQVPTMYQALDKGAFSILEGRENG